MSKNFECIGCGSWLASDRPYCDACEAAIDEDDNYEMHSPSVGELGYRPPSRITKDDVADLRNVLGDALRSQRSMSAAVVRPREDIIEDAIRLWFTIKDTTTVDPAYRTVMAAVVDFVTAVEHERCNQIVRAAWGQNVSIDALSQAIDREGGAA